MGSGGPVALVPPSGQPDWPVGRECRRRLGHYSRRLAGVGAVAFSMAEAVAAATMGLGT